MNEFIARGSGTTVTEVNELISRFGEMQKMMSKKKVGQGMFVR